MKTVQMWRDFNYPKELIACAKTVVNIVGKENYEILCTNPKIPKELGNVRWKNFDEEYAKALADQKNIDWWKTYCTTNYFKSDLIRLWYATRFPDLFYIDADIQLLYLPNLSRENVPYFLQKDFCMFNVNGNIKWFEELIDAVTQNPSMPMIIFHYLTGINCSDNRLNFPNDCCKRTFFGKVWIR